MSGRHTTGTSPMRSHSLWHQPDFLRLWSGESISLLGSQVTLLALPLTAILTLHASPAQMALLAAAGSVPTMIFGLPAGVWVDRIRRRPLLIATNLGTAVVLATIPLAALFGILTLVQLFIVAFLARTLRTFFGAAYQTLLPSLVDREQLIEGNSKLEVSRSVAQIAGPSLTGILVQLVTAPVTITADAVSFVISATTLLRIQTPEEVIPRSESSIGRDIREGITFVLHAPILRDVMGAVSVANLFLGALVAEEILFMSRQLHLTPGIIGLVLAVMGPSGLVGALLASRVSRHLGTGRAIIAGGILYGIGELCLPLASGSEIRTVIIVGLGQVLMGLGSPSYFINFVSLTQAVTPDRLLGRVDGTQSVVMSGTVSIGALVGGFLGQTFGLRPLLVGVGLGVVLAFAALLLSPVFGLHEPPPPDVPPPV